MRLFNQYPVTDYYFEKKDEKFATRNIFLKVALMDHIRDNPTVLQRYVLNSDETPDVLAFKLYKNPDLHWVILMANDVVDPRDWVMGDSQFRAYINEKYESGDEIAYTVRNGEDSSIVSNRFMVEKNPFGTVDSDPDASLTDPSTYSKVSMKELEASENESKRTVLAVKPEFITAFIKDFERKIKRLDGK